MAKGPVKKLTQKELNSFETELLSLRERITKEITFLSDDTLRRSSNEPDRDDNSHYGGDPADQGAANFDREFALNLLSSEQDVLYEIDEALRRIGEGTYGNCEISGEPIERARLEAIPYARYSVRSQEEMERGRTRYRPLGQAIGAGLDRKSAYAELMDQEGED